jgi:hypothetical protein
MSSILVMAKELHAVPIDLPNSMVVSEAVVVLLLGGSREMW